MKQSPCYFNIIEKDLKYCVFIVLMFAKQNKKTCKILVKEVDNY